MTRFSGWRCLVGLYLCMASSIGSFLTFTLLMTTYVTEFNTTLATVSLMNVFAMVMSIPISMFLFGSIFQRLGPRKCFLIGGIVILAVFTMYAHSTSIYFSIFACFLNGIPCAICQSSTGAATVGMWFKKKTGLITSIVFSSLTAGPMIYLFVFGRLISALGWRTGVQIIGLVAGGIVILAGLLLVRDAPETYGELPYGADEADDSAAVVGDSATLAEEAKAIRKTPRYWVLFAAVFALAIFTNAFAFCAPTFLQSIGVDIVSVSNYTTIYNAIGIVIGFVGGIAIEKVGFRNFTLVCAACGLVCLVMLATIFTEGVSSATILAACLLAALCVSAGALVPSLAIMPAFGPQYIGLLVGGMMASFMLGCAVVPTSFGIVADAAGFSVSWLVHAAIGIIGVVLFVMATSGKPEKE